jgi:hypothetical protein
MTREQPQQKDIFTKRWRRIPQLDPRESQVQIALIAQLKIRCRKGVVYFHVPNGEERSDSTGAKLKAMGVLRGVSDLLFFWCDKDEKLKPPATHRLQVLFLELKRRGQNITPEQWAFAETVRECGAYYDCADSVDGALDILNSYGLLKC